MRRWLTNCIVATVLLSAVPPVVQASTAGRRNTAVAATAVAVGAWSNGTGRKGRRNTALVATAGAAYAWKRYGDKKKEERRPRTVRVTRTVTRKVSRTRVVHKARPVRVAHAPRPTRVVGHAHRPACPCQRGCGIKEYENKPSGETKIKYLCGAEWERTASGETKFKR